MNMQSPTSAVRSASARAELPEKIGKYLIINEVGRGSTGTVYLSHDPYYGRDVAIKVYNIDAERRREPQAHRPQDVPVRSAHGRHAAAPEHPADLRRGRGKRPLLHRHRACAWRAHAGGVLPARQPAAHRRRRRDDVQVRQGAALRAFSRGVIHRDIKPSQHHAHARQRRAHHRFRHRAGCRLGDLAHRGHRRQSLATCRRSRCKSRADATAPTCIRSAP